MAFKDFIVSATSVVTKPGYFEIANNRDNIRGIYLF